MAPILTTQQVTKRFGVGDVGYEVAFFEFVE